jgi:hypothetical protein
MVAQARSTWSREKGEQRRGVASRTAARGRVYTLHTKTLVLCIVLYRLYPSITRAVFALPAGTPANLGSWVRGSYRVAGPPLFPPNIYSRGPNPPAWSSAT